MVIIGLSVSLQCGKITEKVILGVTEKHSRNNAVIVITNTDLQRKVLLN